MTLCAWNTAPSLACRAMSAKSGLLTNPSSVSMFSEQRALLLLLRLLDKQSIVEPISRPTPVKRAAEKKKKNSRYYESGGRCKHGIPDKAMLRDFLVLGCLLQRRPALSVVACVSPQLRGEALLAPPCGTVGFGPNGPPWTAKAVRTESCSRARQIVLWCPPFSQRGPQARKPEEFTDRHKPRRGSSLCISSS